MDASKAQFRGCVRKSRKAQQTTLFITVATTAIALATSGCGTSPPKAPSTVRVSEVINAVKDDLRAFSDSPVLLVRKTSPTDVCMNQLGQSTVKVTPKSITLKLKTVAATQNAPSAGLEAPLGILSIDPSYSGSYSRSHANSLEISLSPMPIKPSSTPVLASSMAASETRPLYGTIISMANELMLIDHSKTPCVMPKSVASTIYFDVVNSSTSGVSIKVLGFKIGDKLSVSDEFHQALEIGFDLEGSSPMVPLP